MTSSTIYYQKNNNNMRIKTQKNATVCNMTDNNCRTTFNLVYKSRRFDTLYHIY